MKVDSSQNLCDTVIIQLNNKDKEKEIVNVLTSNELITAKAWNVIGISFWIEQNKSQVTFISLFFNIIALFTIIIAIIGGINAFLMTVLEREKEFGILKLIGAKPRWISLSLLWEAIFTGIIASILGTLFGRFIIEETIMSVLDQLFFPIPLLFTVDHVLLGLLISLITALLSVLYPSFRASKASVISALRYE